MFVPSHAEPTEDISKLAQYNIEKVHEIAGKIIEICNNPKCFEAILQTLFTEYNLKMTFEQYVLVGSTVRSYLAWLKDNIACLDRVAKCTNDINALKQSNNVNR